MNEFNAASEGTVVQVLFDDSKWYDGTVEDASRAPLLAVRFDAFSDALQTIDASWVHGVVIYRPIRVGADYQADLPSCVSLVEREAESSD